MSYTLQEITESCQKIGLSKSALERLVEALPHKRSSQQNKSLHVLFENMAYELNNAGYTFVFKGLKGNEIEIPYTMILVKETIWKPIQLALFGKESTTEATTNDINMIFEALGMWFANEGIVIEFPSAESIVNKNGRIKKV